MMEEATQSQTAVAEQLKQNILARVNQSSMLSAVAAEALRVANEPDCTSAHFTAVVERDVILASEILSLSNSALFACGRKISNLQQAVVRLGLRQCRNLILTHSAATLMNNLPLRREWEREVLYKHSITTATVAARLNQRLRLGYHGEEYAGGLMHDFGRLLLSAAATDEFEAADPLNFDDESNVLTQEQERLGIDHCEFGAWFAARIGLPSELIAAIRYHHDPDFEHENQKLIALVSAADHIANHLQVTPQADGYEPKGNHGIEVLVNTMGVIIAEQFEEFAPELISDSLSDLEGVSQ